MLSFLNDKQMDNRLLDGCGRNAALKATPNCRPTTQLLPNSCMQLRSCKHSITIVWCLLLQTPLSYRNIRFVVRFVADPTSPKCQADRPTSIMNATASFDFRARAPRPP